MVAARVQDNRQPGYFWADNEVVDRHLIDIGMHGFAVYMLLTRYANAATAECDPSIPTIAKSLGISEPTVKKALNKLESCNLITIARRKKKGSDKYNDTNLYTLLHIPKVGNHVAQVDKDVTQGRQPDYPGVGNHVAPNNTKKNKTQRTIIESPPPVEIPKPKPVIEPPPFPSAPKGFTWVSSSDSDQPEAHLTNGGLIGPVLCKKLLAHRNFYKHGQTVNTRQPCQECLTEAAERNTPKPVDPSQSSEVKDAFAKLCKQDWTIDGNASDMGKALRSLNGKATIEALRRFYVNWHKCDWRGKQGQAPKPRQVVEHWIEYTESDDCRESNSTTDDYILVEVKADYGIDNWVERNVHRSKLATLEWRPKS
jgi:hypothetical protein